MWLEEYTVHVQCIWQHGKYYCRFQRVRRACGRHEMACSLSLHGGLSVPLLQLLGTSAQERQHRVWTLTEVTYHVCSYRYSDVEVFTCKLHKLHASIYVACYVQ